MTHSPHNASPLRCVILGSGPAGYTAALYAARAGLCPVVYEGGLPGGQLTETTRIDNFPGYPEGVSGIDLMQDLRTQSERFGAETRTGMATRVVFGSPIHEVFFDDDTSVTTLTLIIATGASAKYLGLPDEQRYAGMGVSACAVCDGFFYRRKVVAVVGGGDTACTEALYLASLARKVYLVVRRDVLRAAQALQRQVLSHPLIEVLWQTEVTGLYGDNGVEGAHLIHQAHSDNPRRYDLALDGLFLGIGHHPNSDIFQPHVQPDGTLSAGVDVDAQGYIVVQHPTTATSIAGVFAAGDVADPLYRQAVSAAGSGCHASLDAERYLQQLSAAQ